MLKQVELIPIVENKKEQLKICEKTSARLSSRGITFTNPEVIATIVHDYLEEAIKEVNTLKEAESEVEISVFGLVTLGISHEMCEEDENDGNFVPYTNPGVAFKALIKDDAQTAQLAE